MVGKLETPDVWPGAFEAFKISMPYLKPAFWTLFLVIIAYSVIVNIFSRILTHLGIVGTGIFLVLDLASIAIFYQITINIYFACIDGTDRDIMTSFNKSISNFVNYLLTYLLVAVICILSLSAFVIPFFFIAPRVVYALIMVAKEDIPAAEAVKKSWEITRGKMGMIYGLIGLNILISLLFLTIIGIPFAIYWGILLGGTFVWQYKFFEKEYAKTQSLSTTSTTIAPVS